MFRMYRQIPQATITVFVCGRYWDLPGPEYSLERWLALAMSWKAIVLIDEADVFMTHRGLTPGHLADTIQVSSKNFSVLLDTN